jgi:hypothetical protein
MYQKAVSCTIDHRHIELPIAWSTVRFNCRACGVNCRLWYIELLSRRRGIHVVCNFRGSQHHTRSAQVMLPQPMHPSIRGAIEPRIRATLRITTKIIFKGTSQAARELAWSVVTGRAGVCTIEGKRGKRRPRIFRNRKGAASQCTIHRTSTARVRIGSPYLYTFGIDTSVETSPENLCSK